MYLILLCFYQNATTIASKLFYCFAKSVNTSSKSLTAFIVLSFCSSIAQIQIRQV